MKLVKTTIALSFLLFTACKDLKGSVVANETFSLKSDGLIEIQPGTYGSEIKIQSKKRINVILNLPQGKQTFVFNTKTNLKNIKPGDHISIPASESGQPVDIDGTYNVTSDTSSTERSVESCTYFTSEYVCRMISNPPSCQTVTECDPQNPGQCATREICTGGGTHEECGYDQVAHSGLQDVEFYYSTTTEAVELSLLSRGRFLGTLRGADSDSHKNYTFQGSCR